MEKNPSEFELLKRKPKEAIKKLILVRSDAWDVGHSMDSSFVASALLLILIRPLTWHGLSFFVCSLQGFFWFPFLKCEVCRVKRVYFGDWASLIKDKWLPCVSKLVWLVKCNVNSLFWNKSLFTCCLLLLNTELSFAQHWTEVFVFPSSLPLPEEGKQS